jgi:hypothetical protein
MQRNIFKFNSESLRNLQLIAADLPHAAFEEERISGRVTDRYRRELLQVPGVRKLILRINKDLRNTRESRGYLIIDGFYEHAADEQGDLRLPTALCSLAGIPFQLVMRLGLWQRLGVDSSIEPSKFGGVGYNPFHIDVVNSTRPPAYVCLFCIRNDPAGGGETIVSNLQRMVAELNDEDRQVLEQPIFREGKFYGISGAGEELNPFPILTPLTGYLWQVRYTGKMPLSTLSPVQQRVLMKADKILVKNQEVFRLSPGQLIIMNQLIVAHGRLSLGANQKDIPIQHRRYLRQTYLHPRRDMFLQ